MSKMSQLHAELTQEAYENGFDSLEEYLADKERNQAHEAWLKEKEETTNDLLKAMVICQRHPGNLGKVTDAISRALKLIENGEQ